MFNISRINEQIDLYNQKRHDHRVLLYIDNLVDLEPTYTERKIIALYYQPLIDFKDDYGHIEKQRILFDSMVDIGNCTLDELVTRYALNTHIPASSIQKGLQLVDTVKGIKSSCSDYNHLIGHVRLVFNKETKRVTCEQRDVNTVAQPNDHTITLMERTNIVTPDKRVTMQHIRQALFDACCQQSEVIM